jgi:hypothetical protein
MDMAPISTVVNRLSFDILGEIFEYYVEGESFTYPLETLLLVCRRWNEAAIGHRGLWTRFKILVGHEPSPNAWLTRLPLRLSRSGSYIPFEIDIRSAFDMQKPVHEDEPDVLNPCHRRDPNTGEHKCRCRWKARATTQRLLHMLAGPSGIYCERWRSLHLSLGPDPFNDEEYEADYASTLQEDLSHPTPRLTSLTLERFEYSNHGHLDIPFLPHIPQLRLFRLWLGDMLPPVYLSNIRIIDIDLSLSEGPTDLSSLEGAVNVEDLTVRYYLEDFVLANELPQLRSLTLKGYSAPLNARLFRAPLLRKLVVTFEEADAIDEFLHNEQLPHSIEELQISCFYESETDIAQFANMMVHFLRSSWKLRLIRASPLWLGICLKVFWDAITRSDELDWINGFHSRALVFGNTSSGVQQVLCLPATNAEMRALAVALKVAPPHVSWEIINRVSDAILESVAS